MRGRNMYVYKLGLTKRSTINNSWITVSLEINSICNIQKQLIINNRKINIIDMSHCQL